MCRKQPGVSLGALCERCDGKCVVCDSYVRPHTLVKLCDECAFGGADKRCVVCSSPALEGSSAYYCKECVQQEKDVRRAGGRAGGGGARARSGGRSLPAPPPQRDGCPKVISIGSAKAARHFEAAKFKTR